MITIMASTIPNSHRNAAKIATLNAEKEKEKSPCQFNEIHCENVPMANVIVIRA